jgi:hypothetical protein
VIGIFRLSTATTPTATGSRRTEVRPFAQIGFTHQHGTGIAQLLYNGGVALRAMPFQRERSRGGHHFIGCINVILYEEGNAVKRTPHLPTFAFLIHLISYG